MFDNVLVSMLETEMDHDLGNVAIVMASRIPTFTESVYFLK